MASRHLDTSDPPADIADDIEEEIEQLRVSLQTHALLTTLTGGTLLVVIALAVATL
jgi:hypothetical protein